MSHKHTNTLKTPFITAVTLSHQFSLPLYRNIFEFMRKHMLFLCVTELLVSWPEMNLFITHEDMFSFGGCYYFSDSMVLCSVCLDFEQQNVVAFVLPSSHSSVFRIHQ